MSCALSSTKHSTAQHFHPAVQGKTRHYSLVCKGSRSLGSFVKLLVLLYPKRGQCGEATQNSSLPFVINL